MMTLEQALRHPETAIVDVRTPAEFSGGSVPGAVNIPLHLLPLRFEEFRAAPALVMCCASGARSGQATSFLKQQGFQNVFNAGSWFNLI
jgi:rhodanese-related sulfurtransferase